MTFISSDTSSSSKLMLGLHDVEVHSWCIPQTYEQFRPSPVPGMFRPTPRVQTTEDEARAAMEERVTGTTDLCEKHTDSYTSRSAEL